MSAFDETLKSILERYTELEGMLGNAELAGDARYGRWVREHGRLRETAELSMAIQHLTGEITEHREILDDPEADQDFKDLAKEELPEMDERLIQLREDILDKMEEASDPDADRNAIFDISGAVGGDEATLFAGDLYRMYRKFFDLKKWKVEVLDTTPSEVGGIRSVTIRVQGAGAFGTLRREGGGHRVQRVPQTETQGRIHTSLAAVVVMPEVEDFEVKIDEKDLEITAMHSQGPGGQSVNTTNSACRILHKPTGINIKCQEMKSFHQNRDRAMAILRARIYDTEMAKREAEEGASRMQQRGSGDRSQRIRTYNFPQNRVTDHRLQGEMKNFTLASVLEGNLDAIHTNLIAEEKLARHRK